MGSVSRVHTFASAAVLTAAQLNNEFDNLLTSSAINGGLDATNLGVTAGQITASKAVVVDGSRNLDDGTTSNQINNLVLSGTLTVAGATTQTGALSIGGGYGATGATISTAGVGQFNGALTTDGVLTGASLVCTAAGTFGGGYGATGATISTDGVLQANGAITSDGAVTGATLAGTISTAAQNSITSASSLATVGTITSGTWSGVIDGSATMTLGSDATGDIYYRDASGFLERLASGADGTVLTGTGAGVIPAWESPTVGDITSVVAGVGLSGGGTTGDVTLTLDISELSTVTPADGDFFATLDSDAANEQKTSTTALATLFAGAGMTATSAVLNVIGGDGITANSNDVAITAAQTTVTSVVNAALALGRDADNQIKFGTDDQIVFEVAGGDGVTFKASGEIEATSLDISGSADIDGTLEADAITLNGTALGSLYSPIAGSSSIATVGTVTAGAWQSSTVVASAYLDAQTAHLNVTQSFTGAKTFGAATQFNSTVTVGVNDTGYDVQLFGATAGSNILWDQSADDLIFTNAGLAVGSDATGDVYFRNASGFLARLGVGTDGQVLTSTGTLPNWEAAAAGGIASVVDDTSPQLGGNLDVLARSITTTTTNGDIAITPHGTGKVILDTNLTFDGSTLGVAGAVTITKNNNYGVSTFDGTNAGGTIGLGTLSADPNGGWLLKNVYYNGSAWAINNSSVGAGAMKFDTAGNILWLTQASGSGLPAEVMRITSAGAVTMPAQPCFLARVGSNKLNVTGNGAVYTIAYDTEVFDQGADFASNTFTAPVAGRYQFNATAQVSGFSAANYCVMQLVASNRTISLIYLSAPRTTTTINGSHIVDMDAGDTAYIKFLAEGESSDVVDVYGGATESYFSGALLA